MIQEFKVILNITDFAKSLRHPSFKDSVFNFYRPKTRFTKVMFLHLSVCSQRDGFPACIGEGVYIQGEGGLHSEGKGVCIQRGRRVCMQGEGSASRLVCICGGEESASRGGCLHPREGVCIQRGLHRGFAFRGEGVCIGGWLGRPPSPK